jgi:hypothetical protein
MPESYSFKINEQGNAAGNLAKIKTEAVGLVGELKGLATAALGIGGIFAGVSFLKTALGDFNKFEESNVKLRETIQSTGGAAGITFGQFKEDADKLSKVVIFPKSSIIEAESMLAMFTTIRGEMMSRTLPVAADLASKFGMDIPQAAKLLGRSLENLQLGRLQMQLGKMSDAQLTQIANFKAAGKVAQAQAVILEFVRSKVGGLSEAMAKTDSGKLKMAAKTLEEFKIQVGALISKLLVGLIPAFNSIVNALKEFKEWITGATLGAEIFRDIIIAVGSALLLYGTYSALTAGWLAIVTAAQWAFDAALWASGIPEIVIAVVALAAAFALLWDKCEGFRIVVGGVFGEIKKVVIGLIDVVADLAKVLYDLFTQNYSEAWKEGKKLVSDFKKDWLEGWDEALATGAKKAADSTFKFGNILGIGSKKEGDKTIPGKMGLGTIPGAVAQSALNTSLLSGASGGLGEAKTIKIDFHKALMEINVPGGNGQDIINKAPLTMELLLRILNNLALSQGATM